MAIIYLIYLIYEVWNKIAIILAPWIGALSWMFYYIFDLKQTFFYFIFTIILFSLTVFHDLFGKRKEGKEKEKKKKGKLKVVKRLICDSNVYRTILLCCACVYFYGGKVVAIWHTRGKYTHIYIHVCTSCNWKQRRLSVIHDELILFPLNFPILSFYYLYKIYINWNCDPFPAIFKLT